MLVLLGMVAIGGCMKPSQPPASSGTAMPTLEVEGWLNGQSVSNDDLSGKVVVVECFAHW